MESTGCVGWQPRSANEPVVAFGPPGSTGELNISVIVAPVPHDFLIEAFGGAEEVGEAIMGTINGRSRGSEMKGTLIASSLRQDSMEGVKLRLRVQRFIATTLLCTESERGGCSL